MNRYEPRQRSRCSPAADTSSAGRLPTWTMTTPAADRRDDARSFGAPEASIATSTSWIVAAGWVHRHRAHPPSDVERRIRQVGRAPPAAAFTAATADVRRSRRRGRRIGQSLRLARPRAALSERLGHSVDTPAGNTRSWPDAPCGIDEPTLRAALPIRSSGPPASAVRDLRGLPPPTGVAGRSLPGPPPYSEAASCAPAPMGRGCGRRPRGRGPTDP